MYDRQIKRFTTEMAYTDKTVKITKKRHSTRAINIHASPFQIVKETNQLETRKPDHSEIEIRNVLQGRELTP